MKISRSLKSPTKISSVANRLKEVMDSKNLRQIDILNLSKPFCVAQDVKMGRNDLSQYVSGKVEPKDDKLHILSQALSVAELWLRGYDVPMEEKPSNYSEEENPYEIETAEALEAMPIETQIPFTHFAKVCAMNPYKAKEFLDQLPLNNGAGHLPDKKENLDQLQLTEVDRELLEILKLIPEDAKRNFLEMGRLYAATLRKD